MDARQIMTPLMTPLSAGILITAIISITFLAEVTVFAMLGMF